MTFDPDELRLAVWQAARIAELESERDFFKKQANLYQHMVITCGVAASHSNANLSRTGEYAGAWNSEQANQVRALRDDRDSLRSRVTELESQIATLTDSSEMEKVRKDAERYRWLRDKAMYAPGFAPAVFKTNARSRWADGLEGEDLDEAMDAAIDLQPKDAREA